MTVFCAMTTSPALSFAAVTLLAMVLTSSAEQVKSSLETVFKTLAMASALEGL
jgi:hypothetical protein